MHTNPKFDAGMAAALGFLVLLIVALACSDVPSGVVRRNDAPLTVPSTLAARAPSTRDVERITRAKDAMRWVGEAHHLGMAVVIANARAAKRAGRSQPRRGSPAYCRILAQVGEATLREADRALGLARSFEQRSAYVRSLPEMKDCVHALSLFGVAMASPTPPQFENSELEVTGAYEPFVVPMEDAVNYSTGGISSVQAATDQVLIAASAAGLPEADMQALAAISVVAVSSATEWNGFDFASVGGGERCDDISCNQMSLFPQIEIDGRVLKLVGADAGGCLAAVKSWSKLRILLGTPAVKALAGYCGVRAAIASGSAFMAMF